MSRPWLWAAACGVGLCALACSDTAGTGADSPRGSGSGGSPAASTGGAPATGGAAPAPTSTVSTGAQGNIFGNGGGFSEGGSGGGAMGCATSSFESDLLPTNILFVVDRSGSMKCLPETSAADCEASVPATVLPASKWSEITKALRASFVELSGTPDTSVGLLFFSNDDVCGVNSTPSVGVNPLTRPQLDALDASLTAVTPGGGTPLVGATVLAYQHLHQEAQAPGNRFVVLVTDGADSCLSGGYPAEVGNDPVSRLLNTELPKAQSVNIRTFVIGAPGSESARGLLSKIASLGGTARTDGCDDSMSAADVGDCHFDMTTSTDFAADFAAALQQITGRAALTCEFALPSGEDVDPDKVNVSFFRGGTEEVELFRDDAVACDDGAQGWQYSPDEADDAVKTKLILCGDACDEVRSDPSGRVDIVLGCETRDIPR